MRSNCLLFALAAWWRWRKQGAYLALRKTRHLIGYHWLVRHPRFDRWVAFEPLRYFDATWREALAKLWYAGKIARDDRPRRVTMAKGMQSVQLEFRLINNDTGKIINRDTFETLEMSPESASVLQMDLMLAMHAMHKEWHDKKFG